LKEDINVYAICIVVGRLGRDPEMRYMPNGDPVTSFSMASDRKYNDRNGQLVSETTWFRVSVFGKQAETTNQYLSKGKLVLVEGRLRCDPKTGGPVTFTRQDGTVGASFEIVANTIRFLSPKSEGAPPAGEAGESAAGEGGSGGGQEESIPF
jgi:single-strand DNA-binding protein